MPSEPIALVHPYLANGLWLKGNLHTHTTVSDGTRPPEEVIADYEGRGYDFLAISDHDKLVPPEQYQRATRMTLLPAVEATANGPHILHVNATALIEPDPDRQAVLDRIRGQGALAVLNHPNWQSHFNHFPQELIERLEGYIGIEVYNGVIERLEGTALASDRWDRLLSTGRIVWGFGTDDSHRPGDVGIAWIVVQAPGRSAPDLSEAIRAGRFYASTGVEVTRIGVEGRTVSLTTANAQRIRFLTQWGAIRATVEGPKAAYTLPDDPAEALRLSYVRAECYGPGGRMAWTQPMRVVKAEG